MLSPKFSPDGKTIAFISDREGSANVFTVPFLGGAPKQLSFHTAGAALQEYTADGNSLLIKATRDHFWRHGERSLHDQCPRNAPPNSFSSTTTAATARSRLTARNCFYTREGRRLVAQRLCRCTRGPVVAL